jgi:cytochrome c oxidase assembly protein subunit 15
MASAALTEYRGSRAPERGRGTLILIAAFLTFGIIVLGAYVRLKDAGLGCPDWPGCYGHLGVPTATHEVRAAEAAYGQQVEAEKAWVEMIHRYFATLLGVLLLINAWLAWRARSVASPVLAYALVAMVIAQGLFGRWTVTLKLMPAVVTLHLLGGMAILAVLTWAASRDRGASTGVGDPLLRIISGATLALLFVQIGLGGWTSTNYAALACPDLPRCHGQWIPEGMAFADGFQPLRALGLTSTGDFLPANALIAIHWMHRLGAIALSGLCLALSVFLLRRGLHRDAWLLLSALFAQVAIGMGNVLGALPLWLAVLHNAGAAVLVVVVTRLNVRLRGTRA